MNRFISAREHSIHSCTVCSYIRRFALLCTDSKLQTHRKKEIFTGAVLPLHTKLWNEDIAAFCAGSPAYA